MEQERPIPIGHVPIEPGKLYTPAHAKGARNEMFVAFHYIELGHQIYWPQIQQDATDLIVDKDGHLHRVQVKTAWWNQSGPFKYLQARMRSTGKGVFMPADGRYDIMAVVFESELWEIPAAKITSSNICLRGDRPGRKPEAWDAYKVR